MKDAFAASAVFFGIFLICALGLYLLGRWHRWIDRRLRGRQAPQYPTIDRADLEAEAAAAECGLYSLPEHIRHRNKFERRRYDAA